AKYSLLHFFCNAAQFFPLEEMNMNCALVFYPSFSRRWFLIVVAAILGPIATSSVHGQGCVCAHLITPGLGAEGTSYLAQGHWSFNSTFRYYNSLQDVMGDHPLKRPIIYANTHIYELDFSATYAVTNRFDLSLEEPVQYGTRKTSIEHDFMSSQRHTMRAFGLGNPRLFADVYLFEPSKSPDRNIALGLGVEFPIGDSNAKDTSHRATGNVERPVDPAIQPAQGGWGILARFHAYTNLDFRHTPETSWLKDTFLYADGTYLATPQELSGTQTPFADEPAITGGTVGFRYSSVVDQFLVRLGLSQLLLRNLGLSGNIGLRFEGVPKWDLIGGSNGFRLPGNSLSIEPGLTLVRGKQSFTVSVPIALHRYGSNFLANERLGHTGAGFDAIADWQLLVGYTRQF
ncbi:MAG: hypothetical protein M3Y69_10650, partial [Verrucomicrobiota bacterium]|nr:hypothetical protein [Verrucomicrobiota bacterium]